MLDLVEATHAIEDPLYEIFDDFDIDKDSELQAEARLLPEPKCEPEKSIDGKCTVKNEYGWLETQELFDNLRSGPH